MRLVVDASVALKWFFLQSPAEQHVDKAVAIGNVIDHGGAELFAPIHWHVEIVAVLARLAPGSVNDALQTLQELRPVQYRDS